MHPNGKAGSSRRDFLRTGSAAGLAVAAPSVRTRPLMPDPIRVGLVGCGGRGTGAARDCLTGSEGVELVALGDLFPDRLARCREALSGRAQQDAGFAAKLHVTDERCFTGFDAYRQVMATDIDMVILATPPGFRPEHLAHAVASGKHVFMEKPVAVDPAGVRSVIASAAEAGRRSLAIVAGTQRRHDPAYVACIRRVHDGAIGQITNGEVYWNQGGLWTADREADWSDMEWQIRNWLYFTWLSGDHICEQHIHNIDVANWVVGEHPIRATGVGGRQWRTEAEFGHIFDHFAIDFEYPRDVHVTSMCRQIDGTTSRVAERFTGTRGTTDANTFIRGVRAWRRPEGQQVNPYVQEHTDLVASIRAGRPLNEGRRVAESTLSAIMGREAAYTGQTLTWDEVLNADQVLAPPTVAFGSLTVPPVPMPGTTTLARHWGA